MGEAIKLWEHQRLAIERARTEDNFALFMDPGVGKTLIAIRILMDKMSAAHAPLRTLVFAPPVVVSNWRREFLKFSSLDPVAIKTLTGSARKRLEVLKERRGFVYITNYESLLMPDLFAEMKQFRPEVIIWDESHRCKNPQSKRTKFAAQLADIAKHRMILTGTPILNSPLDLFSQFRILDGGKTFGVNYFVFRSKYFYDKNASMPSHVHFPNWAVLPQSLDLFNLAIHRVGAKAKKSDCLTLPPLVKKRIEVGLSPTQRKAYDDMKRNFIAFIENGEVAKADLAITKALRLQQIISGFVTTEGVDDEASATVFEDNPRIEALKEVLDNILTQTNEKVVIWSVFHRNYTDIRKLCTSMGFLSVEVHGLVNTAQREAAIERFRVDPQVRVFIGHPRSGGIGINLVEASYSVFYSRDFSLENDIQAEARNYRGGSERHKSVTRIDLVATGTIDELVLERLEGKQAITDRVLRDLVVDLKREGKNK